MLAKVYTRADLFILPSMQEGLPYAMQEAMVYGLPIVITNCAPSIPELIENEKNGLIIDIKNKIFDKVHSTINKSGKKVISKESHDYLTKEIVNNISKLIEDNSLRKRIGENNLKKARNLFSFKKNNKIMRAIYEEAIG